MTPFPGPTRARPSSSVWTRLLLAAGLAVGFAPLSRGQAPSELGAALFRERIEPVLAEQCYDCHSARADKLKAGLLLDSPAGLAKGGDTGPAIDLGNPTASLLLKAIRHEGDLTMPPKKPRLSGAIIADFEKWVGLGAPDPRPATPLTGEPFNLEKARQFWAFQPVRRTAPPEATDGSQPHSPVDRFLEAKRREQNLRASPPATPADLARRLWFDLTGLPPSPEDLQQFTADRSPDAYERLVDQLLDSPHFGERWAQHWLDVVRYAETEGFEYDRHLPDAWRYRDYVVNSFARDKPFDLFLREQIAGDEMAPDNPEAQTAAVFHRLGPVRRNAGNPEIALSRNEVLTERTDVIGAAFIGLTMGCARCHNHKLDPISQRDYYSLQAYLAATHENDILLAPDDQKKAWEQETKGINAELKKLRQTAQNAEGDERVKLNQQIVALEETLPPYPPTIPGIKNDPGQRTAIHVLKRGDWDQKGAAVGPRPPAVLLEDGFTELPIETPNPRLELAQWLTDPKNPLTARVIVNRVWQHHFGTGLVKTPNDFGMNGDRPSHPELLDWLASELVRNEWRLKSIHRLILQSAAYRQSSVGADPALGMKVDPDNRLLWRFNRRRLSAEEIRDGMLAASGTLDRTVGGRSVMVPVDQELTQLLYKPAQWQVAPRVSQHHRRSLYLIAKRNLRLPFMETFDQPALLTSCGRREASTHAPQALEMLNGTLANQLAASFALRLERECRGNRLQMIERGWWLATGRAPTAEERAFSKEFLAEQPVKEFALALFNLNDFLYVR